MSEKTKTQKKSYGSVLETIVVAYYSRDPPALLREIEKIPCVSGHVAVKVSAFLLQICIRISNLSRETECFSYTPFVPNYKMF